MDLLTVVMHDLRHVLGHDHDDDRVMAENLAAGVRQIDLEQDHVALADEIFRQPSEDRANAWLFVEVAEQLDSTRLGGKHRR